MDAANRTLALVFLFLLSGCVSQPIDNSAQLERVAKMGSQHHQPIEQVNDVVIPSADKINPVKLNKVQRKAAEDAVKSALKDPYSVKFGIMNANKTGAIIVVCGWYNAKNSYGGYVGDVPFIAALTSENTAALISAGSTEEKIKATRIQCINNGVPLLTQH